MIDPTTRHVSGTAAQAATALERAADGAAEGLAVLHAEVAVRDAELERLQEVCDDRQRVIDELSQHAATYRRAAEERAGLVAAMDFNLQRMRAELDRAERERAVALTAADAAGFALDEERQRARLQAAERDADVRAAHRDAEMLRARAAVLEEALAARARTTEALHAACDERLRLIDQLSAELAAVRAVADERLPLLDAPRDGVDWRSVAATRERALDEVSAEAERRAVLLAEVTAALEGRTREVEDLRRRLTRAF